MSPAVMVPYAGMEKSLHLVTVVGSSEKVCSGWDSGAVVSSPRGVPQAGSLHVRVKCLRGGRVPCRIHEFQLSSGIPLSGGQHQQHRSIDHLSLRGRSWSRRTERSTKCQAAYSDPELHSVLRLANDTELLDLSNILYGKSFLSPLLKSLTPDDGSREDHDSQPPRTPAERDALMARLEARFLFLAADARATLSGRRPSYRDALLQVRRKLKVSCSEDLSTEDMEFEIFLYLLQQYTRKSTQQSQEKLPRKPSSTPQKKKRRGPRLPTVVALRSRQLLSAVMKGGGAVTVSTLQRLVFKKLSGKVLLETARYQLAKEAVLKSGQLAAMLESRVAVLAAKQGLIGAAKRYVTLRSALSVLGPMMWGTFFADLLISAVGTDYARVVRAIYAFAQIRLLRGDTWESSVQYGG